ncbi:hypothetical protein LCI18_009217 [Fusarium solani-melongenae]|uniref:Uncharacterized protein n=1 Tax=Fusarium solani subsp. cucurbitae TaxID=2747967 RepID=A0ACD3ZAP9_FUSSC|nr:hypothetical protein LCI18_009217 [Fusarium solani-melongenae]
MSDIRFHPPTTKRPVCIGSLIRSTSAPQYPLNRGDVVAVADADMAPPAVETDWKKTISADKQLGLGVYAQFLQVAIGGLGSELDVERSSSTANTFAFDTVTTLAFEPTQEYLREAIKAPAVQVWLKEPKQSFSPAVSLFLVTGLKLVKGARIKYSTSQNTKVTGNIGIDVRTNEDQTEFNRESEFVFAFRVKRLKFGRRLKVEEHNQGAFLAIGEDQQDSESVLIEDVDGSGIKTARVVPDVTENGSVYCVPA